MLGMTLTLMRTAGLSDQQFFATGFLQKED
jgi:hypothetical protein